MSPQVQLDDSAYLNFWGKAAGSREGEPAWHPLAYHSLDVAAVANVLLSVSPRQLDAMARHLGVGQQDARRFLVSFIALHDIGKFSTSFQGKCEAAWPNDPLGPYQPPRGEGRHDNIGSQMFDGLDLAGAFGPALADWSDADLLPIWQAVVGHHGQPAIANPSKILREVTKPCWDAARDFVKAVSALFPLTATLNRPDERALATLSWSLAGLTVIADWIGSNRNWFPYTGPVHSIPEYWNQIHPKAETAVRCAGVLPVPSAAGLDPLALVPQAASLSPLQTKVAEIALPGGPLLTIIEDVTGSGKTEAALILAQRLMCEGRADGIFFALPTMATADAMYARLAKAYRLLFVPDAAPSLVLAHGKRRIHDGFTSSILGDAGQEADRPSPDAYDESASATCAAWVADDRRKAFLAHVGIGTIDQALLGVLPSRHQSLRLWGLSDRVLIVDEAHAYDAYMSKELETLIEFQAALGGSVIVLSATLPAKQKQSLMSAFERGLGRKPSPTSGETAYPLLSVVSADKAAAIPLPTRNDRTRRLPVRRIATTAEAVAHVVDAASRGAAVAWIRNAVDDVLDAAAEVERHGLTPIVLHARYAMGDRLKIEDVVRRRLGRDGTPDERRGLVLLGTQILEQSLDYDVDAMVTDLAPIDLMIQRAGRLWRHTHRDRIRPLPAPELVVLSGDPSGKIDRNWYHTVSKRAAAVYDHHGLVWRSAQTLFAAKEIVTPGNVRTLIESVYGADTLDEIPEPLQKSTRDAEGKRQGARSVAKANLLTLKDGYGGNAGAWTADTITPTRLGEPVMVFRLGLRDGTSIVPWCRDADGLARQWALSEVSLRMASANGVPEPNTERRQLIDAAKSTWATWEQNIPLLVLEGGDGEWRGQASKDQSLVTFSYSTSRGLDRTQ